MAPEAGLGGKLLYAGEPDESGCRLLRAANIAAAASLAAAEDAAVLRRAMREGVIDFVVNSLDEALRILKNEIRKRQTVAVGVSVAQPAIVQEMLERGVQPDLLAAHLPAAPELARLMAQGMQPIEAQPMPSGVRLQIFPVPPAWAQPMAAFDALLLEFVGPQDHANRRWVRLAPRYLGVAARRLRSLACDDKTAARLAERVAQAAEE